jgi:DNA-directed RNA polymerase
MSKKFVQENILGLADIFEDVPEFFIPVIMDFRGRIYCETNYLNYQGTDLAKSLLLFAKGEKILKSDTNSIDYLKIFGANCYGNKLDKKSFNDRLKCLLRTR